MGKEARLRRERRAAPPSVGANLPTARTIWLGTGGLVLAIAVIATVLAFRSHSISPPPPAQPSASDRNAPAALVEAADKVGFHPTTEPGVGEIEGKPASAGNARSDPNALPVGTTAPAFALKTPQGDPVSLQSFRGKAVLLEFFATWCPHCNAEAPHLKALAQSLGEARFAFVSVNADSEDAPSVFAYHRYYGLPFLSLLDPGSPTGSFHQQGGPGPVTLRYRIQSYPTFYVLDSKGRIFWATAGEQPDALIRAKLQAAARAG
jgi:thiol-disulfide isomerase/thioredoxin